MFDLDDKSVKVTRVKLDSDKFSHSFYVSNHFKLCLIMKGGGIWQIGNECISVREMDIVMLSTRQKRMFKEVSITDGIEMIVIEFGLQLCATHFQGLFLTVEKNTIAKYRICQKSLSFLRRLNRRNVISIIITSLSGELKLCKSLP